MKKILAFILAYGLMSHTLASTSSATLTSEQLIEILVDLELAKAMINIDNNNPIEANALLDEQAQLIYAAHEVDMLTFQKSYISYLNDPVRLQDLCDQIINKLEKLLQTT